MRRFLRRLGYLAKRRRIESELAEELEAHRSMRQHDLEAEGMPPDEAAAASRRALGNVTLAREDARAVWVLPWLEGLWQDARYACRAFYRAPAFAVTIVFVMSLGIGATTGVFGLVDGLMLKDLPVSRPERLVYFTDPSFSFPILREVRSRASQVFSNVSGWDLSEAHVQWSSELEPREVLNATGTFFDTLGIAAAAGRLFGPDDDQVGGGRQGLVAVITHAAWRKRFGGDPSVSGRTVQIDGKTFTIVGVTPAGFFGVAPGLAPEIIIPVATLKDAEWFESHSSSSLHLLARLRDGLSIQQANAALTTFWPDVLETTTPTTLPAERRQMYLGRQTSLQTARAGFSRVRNQFAEPLWVLLGLVGLLMLVACASASNLLFARSVARNREMAVRLAIGAGRGRLIRQLLTEAAVWTAFASLLGLGFAMWGGAGLVALMSTRSEPIVLDVTPGWRLVAFAIALAFATAAICAVVPAFRATRIELVRSLKDGGIKRGGLLRRWSFAKLLVTVQVALTIVLLFGAALFVGSLRRVLSEDAGIERNALIVLSTDPRAAGYEPHRIAAFYDELVGRLRRITGVTSASLAWYPPISDEDGAWTQSVEIDGVPVTPERSRYVYFNAISPDYFETVGMHVLSGRDFSVQDTVAGTRVVAVNEDFVQRFFPGQNAIGRRVTIGRQKSRRDLEIVAVVSNAKYRRLDEPSRSIAYLPAAQLPELAGRNLTAQVRTAGSTAMLSETLRREVRDMDGRIPLRIETVSDRIRVSLVRERVTAILASGLGLVALALATAALYGLLAYAVSRQSHEIGLRIALGADRPSVLRLVLRECLVMSLAGTVLGIGASLALGRYAASLLYEIGPRDPGALTVSAALMLTVALLAALIPARRAMQVDPVVALRQE